MPATTDPVVASTRPFCGDQVEGLEERHERARVIQDRLPCERAHQVGDEERQDHREQQRVAPAPAAERDRVRERVADQQDRPVDEPGVPERAEELRAVVVPRVRVGREVPAEAVAGEDRPGLQRDLPLVVEGQREEDDQPQRAPATAAPAAGSPCGAERTTSPAADPTRRLSPGRRCSACPLPPAPAA